MLALWIVLGIVAILLIFFIATYNGLIGLRNELRNAWAQIEVLTFHNADARIRTAFYHMARQTGIETASGVKIPMHLTHKEISDIVGISRETATRVLTHLQELKLIKVETRHFIVNNPDQLVGDLLFE